MKKNAFVEGSGATSVNLKDEIKLRRALGWALLLSPLLLSYTFVSMLAALALLSLALVPVAIGVAIWLLLWKETECQTSTEKPTSRRWPSC
jgi:hypothetical protein